VQKTNQASKAFYGPGTHGKPTTGITPPAGQQDDLLRPDIMGLPPGGKGGGGGRGF